MAENQDSVGVSRSGRLRKRPTKLAGFESSDESEAKSPKKNVPEKTSRSAKYEEVDAELSDFDDMDLKDEDDWELPDDDSSFLTLPDEDQDLENLNLPADDLEFPLDDVDIDEDANQDDAAKEEPSTGVANSLYFSEKHGGRKGKDAQTGKKRKTQRKDKGQSRFTAYMLWAREIRPELVEKHPDMDFSAINKKLGELWQLVPNTQKYSWKARAKRLAVRIRQSGMISTGKAGKNAAAASTKAVEKGSGSRSRRVSAPKTKKEAVPKVTTPVRTTRSPKSASSSVSPTKVAAWEPSPPPAANFRVTGTTAIDVAAHMKLLGESLNNIGHKLKEHEGQIAVSGSLSVLLDSMLCVLGPLMCLTEQVKETRGSIDPQTHAAILDNIAYIMPGIV